MKNPNFVPGPIQTEWVPVEKIQLFKVYQNREEYIKDYPEAAAWTDEQWFTLNMPLKSWVDPDFVPNEENPYETYTYKALKGTKLITISIPAYLVSKVNIPPKKASNEHPPNMLEIPVPVRELVPPEYIKPSTFGIPIVVNADIEAAAAAEKPGFTVSDRQMLREIYRKAVQND